MRKICLVTTTRAEYGIMSRLINKLNEDADIDFSLVVSGAHLSKKFGETYKEISVPIVKKIDIEIEKSPAHSMALTLEKFDKFFKKLNPDIVVLLGDRYETMAIAIAAMLNNIPIAHLHGGETTEGAIDEAIRHSITKMSYIHFTSCEEYRKRVIQLGENPERVFNVGSLGVENIKTVSLMKKEQLEASLGLKFGVKNILVTFHPVTLEKGLAKMQVKELISALNELKDTNIIITMPNSDAESDEISKQICEFEKENKNVYTFKSLGMLRYLSTLQYVDMVVGNSSSGIIEVPSFKIPTVNIGDRQKGRIQAKSVINCYSKKEDILQAISEGYHLDCSDVVNPYEGKNTLEQIVKIIKDVTSNEIHLQKSFYNIG